MSDPNEALKEAIKQLAGDPRFQSFMAEVNLMREAAIDEGTRDLASLASQGTAYAALGEIRAYTNLQNLVKQHADLSAG